MNPRFSRATSSFVACLIILGLVAFAVIQSGQRSVLAKNRKANSTSKPQILAAYAGLPLSFEANQGQTDSQVQFLSRGNGYTLFLTPTESVLTLRKIKKSEDRSQKSESEPRDSWPDPSGHGFSHAVEQCSSGRALAPEVSGALLFNSPASSAVKTASVPNDAAARLEPCPDEPWSSLPATAPAEHTAVLRMKLLGANPAPPATGLEELPGKSNYFIGNDPKQWRTNVPNYGKVRFAGVYPGVDLVYYGNQRQLEYDFVVAPGADPSTIRLEFAGAERLEIDLQGELALETPAGEVRWHKPVVYQEIGGVRHTVDGNFVLRPDTRYLTPGTRPSEVGFAVASYDPRHPLIIDPVLVYSTYLGGSGFDPGVGIAVDSLGNAYVTGETSSPNFPTTAGAFQTAFSGAVHDAFVTKLNAGGSALVYSTYLGGSDGQNRGRGIAVDSLGNAYMTGETTSPTFPTTLGAFQTAIGVGVNAVVTKLNATGNALVYSTYLGGGQGQGGLGIAVDSSGNAHVTGYTYFSSTGTFDAFVTKLNAAGSALVYSTYLGGSGNENSIGNSIGAAGSGIAVDSSGNAYVTGATNSTNFPTTLGAFQTAKGGGAGSNAAFVTKLDTNASGPASLVYSTYLGGGFGDVGNGIAVDSLGNAYVTGLTASPNFPTVSPFQAASGGGTDAFVTKLNAAGSALVYSTYLGGNGFDGSIGIAVDSLGNAYVTGDTTSTNFPTANAFQGAFGGGFGDALVSKISEAPTTTRLTLMKVVTNDNGGTKTISDFPLSAGGPTPITNQISGTAGATNVAVDAGTYVLSEVIQAGYTASQYSCVKTPAGGAPGAPVVGNAITLALRDSAVCTITNDDQPALLTLVKVVTNDNGGTKTISDFPLSAAGPTPITNQISGKAGATNVAVNPGTYALSEQTQAGYTASAWVCVGGSQSGANITLALGDNATCTITNTSSQSPPPPAISELKDLVNSLPECNRGQKQRLLASLNAAEASIERGNTRAACNQLGAFVNKVEAKEDKEQTCIDPGTAHEMINLAEALQASLGCG